MGITSAIGTCPKCHQGLLSVEGRPECIFCKEPETSSGIVVNIEDPGEEALNAVLGKNNVKMAMGGSKPEAPVKPSLPGVAELVKATKAVSQAIEMPVAKANELEYYIHLALSNLKNAPMPKDLKQFKAIQKAIKILEGLQ